MTRWAKTAIAAILAALFCVDVCATDFPNPRLYTAQATRYDQDLPVDFTPIHDMAITFTVDRPSLILVSGNVDTRHRGAYGTADKAIMVSFKIALNGSWMPGSTVGGNIVGVAQHYLQSGLHASAVVPAGTHTIMLYGRSAISEGGVITGMVAEIKASYNKMTLVVLDQPTTDEVTEVEQ